MQRPCAVIGDEVGDIDKRRDGAQANGFELVLQPSRGGPVFQAFNHAAHKGGASLGDLCFNLNRAREATFDAFNRLCFKRAKTHCGEVTRNTIHAEPVWAVGRDFKINHRIVEV